jgi:hypothetical protein
MSLTVAQASWPVQARPKRLAEDALVFIAYRYTIKK